MAWKLPSITEGVTKATKAFFEELRTKFEESVTEILVSYATTSELAAKAPLASPSLTGTPTAPTATGGTNTTQISTTAFVHSEVAVKAPIASPTFTGTTTAPEFSASGLTGATAASRYVGATSSGAPASGTFAKGDFTIDQSGAIWVCTTAGSPGTWQEIGAGGGGGGVGSWTAPESLGTGLANASGFKPVEARTENGGATARLKGALKVEAGKTVAVGEPLLTLSSAFRPNLDKESFVGYAGTGAYLFTISTAGVVICTANLPAASFIYFGSDTWSLT